MGLTSLPFLALSACHFLWQGRSFGGPLPNAGLPALRHFHASLRTCPVQGPKIIVPPRDYGSYRKLPLSRVGSTVLVQVIRSKSERNKNSPPNHQQIAIFALAGNEALQGVAGCARYGQRGYGSVDSNHGPIFGAHLGSARDRGAGGCRGGAIEKFASALEIFKKAL